MTCESADTIRAFLHNEALHPPFVHQDGSGGRKRGSPALVKMVLVSVLGVVLCSCEGCASRDDLRPSDITLSYLNMMGRLAVEVIRAGKADDILRINSCTEFVAYARAQGFREEHVLMTQDAWGRAYTWDRTVRGKASIIRIICNGVDGRYEKGDGDDLYVEIIYEKNKEVVMTLKGVCPGRVNHPPSITSTPETVAVINKVYQYQVTASDADGDQLSYHLVQAPAGMSIDLNTGLIAWTPSGAGSFVVQAQGSVHRLERS